MVLTLQDWIFRVDVEKTLAYSKSIVADHCQCGYCRNYYHAVDGVFPELRSFLSQFGADVEGPDELMPFEPTLYRATYCICGEILTFGSDLLRLDNLSIEPLQQAALDFETACPAPCFALHTSYMDLPWVLDEDMDEVLSPANEPEYLERMWEKLLMDAPNEAIYS